MFSAVLVLFGVREAGCFREVAALTCYFAINIEF